MYANLGPGQIAERDPPSPNGVDVLYSHEYVAERMRERNLHGYVRNNPLIHTDSIELQGIQFSSPSPPEEKPNQKPKDKDCPRKTPPPPKTVSWQPKTLSGDDNTGVVATVFTCRCPYKVTDKGCLEPIISYFSRWEPVKGVQDLDADRTEWAEYLYCICRYPDDTENVFLADEGVAVLA